MNSLTLQETKKLQMRNFKYQTLCHNRVVIKVKLLTNMCTEQIKRAGIITLHLLIHNQKLRTRVKRATIYKKKYNINQLKTFVKGILVGNLKIQKQIIIKNKSIICFLEKMNLKK